MASRELWIPGPTQVRPEVLAVMAEPLIGHRTPAMRELLADCLPGVRECFGTAGDVVILTCSSTAAMEAVVRAVVRPGRRVVHLINGNFSHLWSRLSASCGVQHDKFELEWGDAFDQDRAQDALSRSRGVDAVFVTHCETSTGALSDPAGVGAALREVHPEALLCVDVTSSACGVPIEFDEQQWDIAVGGVQKAWALPPGIALAAMSARAKQRMSELPDRGYANDLLFALEYQNKKAMTVTTPAIPVFRSLRRQIQSIHESGGFSARYRRHQQMQETVRHWVARNDFGILAKPGFQSPTVTSIDAKSRFEITALLSGLQDRGFSLGAGYGRTKASHWRIGHMGDHTPDALQDLLRATEEVLDKLC